jgi:beta-lactamase regulating signal transducer with metallopeptidase domain
VAKETSPAKIAGQTSSPAPWFLPWGSVIPAGIYLAGAGFLLTRFFVGLVFTQRLRQSSQVINEECLRAQLVACASAFGLATVPKAAESQFISVPATVGALRSLILLPAGWREWEAATLHAVLAHEVSHVARRDALTQRLSLLHRSIFWFSPLAWWLDRHLADLAEQASDEATLSSGADRTDYAQTLLHFLEAMQAAPGRVWWQGVAMAEAGRTEQRLERILDWKGTDTMNLKSGVKRSIAVVLIAFSVPVVYLAASARPVTHGISSPAVYVAQGVALPLPGPSAAPVSSGLGAVAVAAGSPAATPASVAELVQSGDSESSGHGYSYSYGYDDDSRFVIVTSNSDSLTMSGSMEDAHHVERLKKSIPGDFIWFERDEKSYIIRDRATIERARKLWAPQEELGKKQEELGKQQEALGKQQEEIGAKMEQVHVAVPDMTAELDKLRAELKQLNSGATVEQVGRIQSEIGELQSRIGRIQSEAGEQQSKLGEQQGDLGAKQGKLGAQQGELGRQQAELARKANREMKQLLDEAIAKGIAQPEL